MRRTLPVTIASAAVLVVLLVRITPLLSHQPGEGGRGEEPRRSLVLTALDTDGDGTIGGAELAAAPSALATLDRDRDGRLAGEELRPAGGEPRGAPGETAPTSPDELTAILMDFDCNGDGRLTSAELPERFAGLLARADANKDAALTAAEITASAAATPAPEGEGGRGGGRGRGGDPLVLAIDADRDGAVSAEEMPTGTVGTTHARPQCRRAGDARRKPSDAWPTGRRARRAPLTDVRSPGSGTAMTRRLMFAVAAVVLCLSAAALWPRQARYERHHDHILGTSLDLAIVADSAAAADRAEAAALAEIARLDRILSGYSPESEFSRWARSVGEPHRVSPELFDVLALFDEWRARTAGALDPAAEAVVRVWQTAAQRQQLPTTWRRGVGHRGRQADALDARSRRAHRDPTIRDAAPPELVREELHRGTCGGGHAGGHRGTRCGGQHRGRPRGARCRGRDRGPDRSPRACRQRGADGSRHRPRSCGRHEWWLPSRRRDRGPALFTRRGPAHRAAHRTRVERHRRVAADDQCRGPGHRLLRARA